MIKYARSLKTDEASFAEAVRVLEQGLSYFSGGGLSSASAAGRVQLSLATVHANRSNFEAAAECLQQLMNTKSTTSEVKGAALEALIGLCLQMHQDSAAMEHAECFMKLVEENDGSLTKEHLAGLKCRAAASKRLVDLAHVLPTSDSEVRCKSSMLSNLEDSLGAAALAFAESYHVQGSLSYAKDLYEESIRLSKKQLEENGQDLAAIAMVPEAIQIGAMASLGQLLTVMGNYDDAESQLTEALKQAERVQGDKHPQVGMILSCIGDLYQHRGLARGGGDSLLTEGIYKSALDILKAPPIADGDIHKTVRHKEIIVLTRARLGLTLAPAFHRRSEAEKLKRWVEAAWNKSQPLPELLQLEEQLTRDGIKPFEKTEVSKFFDNKVVDVRLGRVFYR